MDLSFKIQTGIFKFIDESIFTKFLYLGCSENLRVLVESMFEKILIGSY